MPKNATPYALEQSHASGVVHGQARRIMCFHPILKNGVGEMTASYLPSAMIATGEAPVFMDWAANGHGDHISTVPNGHGTNGN